MIKRIIKHTAFALLICLLFAAKLARAANIQLQNLRCEMLVNPQGIDAAQPRLSWQILSEERGVMQTAYHILVASSPQRLAANQGDLWDSHKVSSEESIMVPYAGKALGSRMPCYWKVKVWTSTGESNWSKPANWSTGLLKPADWKACWVGAEHGFAWDSVSKFSRLSARYFRKEFRSAAAVKRAMVYVVGLGHYELYINGNKVGDQVLAQMPTDYNKSVLYNTFDVTPLLKKGSNAIAAVLGNGRYFTMRPKYKPKKIKEFGFPKMLLQLEVEYTDGTKKLVVSDGSWKMTADGPIRSNNEYDGEEYDATKELTGWTHVGYNDSKWLKPEIVPAPAGRLAAQMSEHIKVMQIIKPVSLTELKPGTCIMDMGQNFSGWVQMKVKGKRGDKVTLRFAETLQTNGELYTANLRDAKVTDVYTLKGGATEIWHPVFVYHGFRYVEITGYRKPDKSDFEGHVVYDALANTGQFETSNPIINQICRNAYWGILSNYKGMPVDCPQRNERMPWLGDRATGCLGESFVFDNHKLYAKWLDDIEDAQTPEGAIPDVAPAYWNYYSDNMTWPGTYLLIADMLYKQYGDIRPVEKHYPSMKKWLSYMQAKYMKDYIMTKDKYGDWCVPPESPELIHSRDSSRNTNGQLIATAYHFRMLFLMKRFAKMLGKQQDAQEFSALSAKIREAFNTRFFIQQTHQYDNGTVTANLLPLYFDIRQDADKEAVFENIVNRVLTTDNGHIGTGVIGTQWLMRGLTENGRSDLAYRIATNTDYPSWGYMAKHGATTIWELWNGDTANPSMNSGNHIMLLGDLITWYYQNLAGIKVGVNNPGFKQVIMKPNIPEGLTYVKASYRTPYGQVKSEWHKEKNFNWQVTIPANCTALISIPASSADVVTEGGKKAAQANGVKFLKMDKGMAVFEAGSGNYSFAAPKTN
ncbi:family 78 glycoside hydrolase catalytic domain [Mucilaginibacter sp. Bleaf8]|uniref:alpha-L-rhamnosidase n=1 Tax=Mucilaginibacter sp. Bleaf8 TaxID=2834430 RepID=UPI001BCF4772|nr:alpha-L-rhamnosidase [Mucilaginibacter sp. Bleaf8]MBS7564904.1 family 78 glycoside hydrolase catalytic domain [Mucilaginibacter sp. Bleaf8]